jgi:hypothetical protein
MPIDEGLDDLPKVANTKNDEQYINNINKLTNLLEISDYIEYKSTLNRVSYAEFVIDDVPKFIEDVEIYKQIKEPIINLMSSVLKLEKRLHQFNSFIEGNTKKISDNFLESNININIPSSIYESLSEDVYEYVSEINSSFGTFEKSKTHKPLEKTTKDINRALEDIYNEKNIVKLYLTSQYLVDLIEKFIDTTSLDFQQDSYHNFFGEKVLIRINKILEFSPGKSKIKLKMSYEQHGTKDSLIDLSNEPGDD